jgi:hypothetical protein
MPRQVITVITRHRHQPLSAAHNAKHHAERWLVDRRFRLNFINNVVTPPYRIPL